MLNNKLLTKIIIAFFLISCMFAFSGCDKTTQPVAYGTNSQDQMDNRIEFGKKYYSLTYDECNKNEYYVFNSDGSASYNSTIKQGNSVTFQQTVNFKWTYVGEGDCILIHNGTKIIKGTQDDAFGFSRVMRVSKNMLYWSSDGENTYFICESYLNKIPNYGKFIAEN